MSKSVHMHSPKEVVDEQTTTNQIKRTVSDSDEMKVQPKKKMMSHISVDEQVLSFCSASTYMKKIINVEEVTNKQTIPIPYITDEELLQMTKEFENTHKD
ncbi:unnamed protein product [Adineta ricciae]|uniref:Uncharacterized protein n=1 Tax=Adineta ricciae TaxID=249248 RepID=A0A815A2D2_ADIRI|nr:unnamed protein product [Adineta ricciae]CAF1486481.1 unnamed protein product [Adineta ricciae]